jgi:hypothetical protein
MTSPSPALPSSSTRRHTPCIRKGPQVSSYAAALITLLVCTTKSLPHKTIVVCATQSPYESHSTGRGHPLACLNAFVVQSSPEWVCLAAGATVAVSVASMALGIAVKLDVAITGEMRLRSVPFSKQRQPWYLSPPGSDPSPSSERPCLSRWPELSHVVVWQR